MSRELNSLLKSQSEFASNGQQRVTRIRVTDNDRSSKRRAVMEVKEEEKVQGRKVPEKLKELLETRLLDNFPVIYRRGPKGNSSWGVMGVIKGTEVVCYCANCNGIQAVTPMKFELHAGSGNKRPADYMYLDNGKSLRDILNACKNATLDNFTEIIETAIGLKPKTDVSCVSAEASDAVVADRQSGLCSSSASSQCNTKGYGRITRKDLRKHKLVWEEGVLEEGAVLSYCHAGKDIRKGFKKGCLIVCECCSVKMSPSEFEGHAGYASRRKPYNSIYTSDGISLHELSIKLIKDNKFPVREYDSLCSICRDGGELVSCDSCPRSFHAECISLRNSEDGKFCCTYCIHLFREETSVTKNPAKGKCRRQFKATEDKDFGCVLCRSIEFNKESFDNLTIMICDQCEREYHVGCLKKHNMDDLQELPEGAWLCSKVCETIYAALEKLASESDSEQNIQELGVRLGSTGDVQWKILSGRYTSSQSSASKQLLSKVLAIFHERFGPISFTNNNADDLIPDMLYGRSYEKQNFEGMHCAVLLVDSSVVSAALFRVFGQELAELPLVATSSESEGKGYFPILYSYIEELLSSLHVKNLVLPAAADVESMWIQNYGFERMPHKQLKLYQMDYQLSYFSGISMLQKPLS